MASRSFVDGGCTQPAGANASSGLAGGLVASLDGNGVEMLKGLAVGLLVKQFTVSAGAKPPKPPWVGLGEPAAPGSAVSANAMEAYSAAHHGPVLSDGSACGGGGAPAATVPGGGAAQPSSSTPASGYPYDPRGAPAGHEEWERYLGMPVGSLPEYDPNNPDAFDYLDTLPLEDPWYADFLGGNMEDGYTALFGLIELGSPKWPGAGTHGSWWVPDKIFGYDMSPYYAWHDERFDSRRGFGDMPAILAVEALAFMQGLARVKDPIHLGLQVIYSSATTLASFVFATQNLFKEERP